MDERITVPYWVPAVLLLAAAALVPFDLTIARWMHEVGPPGELRRLIEVTESFGNGWGAALIALGVAAVLAARKVRALRILTMSLGAGLFANLLKLLVARTRPRAYDFDGMTSIWGTFHQLFPFLRGGSDQQAFPSAHSATAAGLALALTWLTPRARWYFAIMAFMVMLQRVVSSAHWPSDTLAGAAVGLLFARWCLPEERLGRVFDRLEATASRDKTEGEATDAPKR